MTIPHEDANARLLDFVYGEASPAERADLDAHVAGCARCQADLAALGGTRAFVRAALVEQGAPKGAHARLLAAATEAVAPVASARGVPARGAPAVAAAPAAPTRAAAPVQAPSLWQRLRRGWTVPTFATVAAFAILLLASKVFLSPARTYERGHEGLEGSAPPVPAARARVDEMAPAGAAAAAPPPREEAGDEGPSHDPRRRALGVARDKSMRHEPGADGLSGALGGSRADDGLGAGAARGSIGGLGRIGAGAGGGAFASPPTGWKGGAPARPAPAPPRIAAKKDVADELERAAPAASSPGDRNLADEPSERQAPARAKVDNVAEREAPARAKAENVAAPEAPAEKSRAAPQAAPSAAAAQAPGRNDPASDDADATGAAPPPEALARRAEQLYVAHRWDEAAAAYRELLRRYPAAERAAKWRARLTEAERASAEAMATRAKSAAKTPAKDPAKPAGAPAKQP